MVIDILTIFPEMFRGALDEGIIKRAQRNGLVSIRIRNIRDYTQDRHRQVDDYPFGGGPGMVLKPEPISRALRSIRPPEALGRVIYLTPQGELFNQLKANELSLEETLVFICGHYKGIDERIREKYVTDEISIGDYVISGGELAAMVVIDAVVRLLPGALGDPQSALDDSFQNGLLDCPWYTRPRVFEGMKAPEVLFSGDHQKIHRWRMAQALERTRKRRHDLLERDESKIQKVNG
ncbi:MAG: tRNA (guanosine(37)-N1)-methyltransferase TrmD [Candidatus Latescibacteria bacterium]|nr:tRNA (guanosine(37)-N1)-methyltransferase TrmD [Candidatus Latescibacterota bacterium]